MGHVINSIHIDAPPERVFELITDAQRFPEWGDSVIEGKDVSGPQDRVGASFTAVMKFAGRRVESRFETTRVEKPTYLEQKGTMPGGGDSTAINRLEPAGGGTDAKVELDYELPGGFFGDLLPCGGAGIHAVVQARSRVAVDQVLRRPGNVFDIARRHDAIREHLDRRTAFQSFDNRIE